MLLWEVEGADYEGPITTAQKDKQKNEKWMLNSPHLVSDEQSRQHNLDARWHRSEK